MHFSVDCVEWFSIKFYDNYFGKSTVRNGCCMRLSVSWDFTDFSLLFQFYTGGVWVRQCEIEILVEVMRNAIV